MHDSRTIGIPVLAILFGIFMNQKGIDRLEVRIDRLEGRIDQVGSRIDRVQADLAKFYRTLGEHGARLDEVEKRRSA